MKIKNKKSDVVTENKDNTIAYENSSLLDDAWFTTSLDDNPKLATFILQIIIGKDDLVVKKISSQKKLSNIKNRSVILDALAFDSNNTQYNIEIQKTPTPDIKLRTRYHLSLLDSYNLRKSNDFNKLPETYIIFICDFDLFNKGEPIYLVERKVNDEFRFDDLEHIIFVNCKYDDTKTNIGKLIHDIKSKIGEEKCYNIFVENEEGGEDKMGEQCERLRQEGIVIGVNKGKALGAEQTNLEHIIEMLKEGYPIESISKITKKTGKDIIAIKNKNKL